MGYYLKKIAVSGAISATVFGVFLYFVYSAANAKNNGTSATKQYAADTVARVNDIVTQAVGKTGAQNTAAPAQIPAATPPSAPIVIPTVTTVPEPTAPTPAPQPAPTIQYQQPRRTVTIPRTTVS